jgi:hypothetical protein
MAKDMMVEVVCTCVWVIHECLCYKPFDETSAFIILL